MKKAIYVLFAIGLLVGFGSCEMRDELRGNSGKLDIDEGVMKLDLSADKIPKPIVTQRVSFPTEDVDINNYTIKIINVATEIVVKECSYTELMDDEDGEVTLTAGKYRVVAYNYDGSAVAASERPFFQGQTDFQILAGKTTTVNTTCRLQNIGVYLKLPDSFKTLFKDNYSVTITNGANGVYIFTKDNINKIVYFAVPENMTTIQMGVKATTKTNIDVAESYTIIKKIEEGDSPYWEKNSTVEITINVGDEPSVEPGTSINWEISVDLTMNESGLTIEIPTENIIQNPGGNTKPIEVTGLGKTYNIDILDENVPTVQVKLTVPNGIQKLLVKIESDNDGFMGALEGFNLVQEFDLANPGDLLGVLSGSFEDLEGIGLIDADDPVKGKTSYLIDVTEFMTLLKMFGVSANTFTITVADGVNEDVSGKLNVNIIEE